MIYRWSRQLKYLISSETICRILGTWWIFFANPFSLNLIVCVWSFIGTPCLWLLLHNQYVKGGGGSIIIDIRRGGEGAMVQYHYRSTEKYICPNPSKYTPASEIRNRHLFENSLKWFIYIDIKTLPIVKFDLWVLANLPGDTFKVKTGCFEKRL